MIDQFNTPDSVARTMVDYLPEMTVGSIFDPTVGGGALLSAAEERFGRGVHYMGADNDPRLVARLAVEHQDWNLGVADALEVRSRRVSPVWRQARLGVSAILMNPPFSFRGNGGVPTLIGEQIHRLSPATAMFKRTLEHAQPTWGMVAVVPLGSLSSAKDASFWSWADREYGVSVVEVLGNRVFPGAVAATAVVTFTTVRGRASSGYRSRTIAPKLIARASCICVELIRGRVPTGRIGSGPVGVPFVHTTDLVDNDLRRSGSMAGLEFASLGRGVLLPRVGRPVRPKIVKSQGPFVLSDCLFFLRVHGKTEQDVLASHILDNIGSLIELYTGTGAPHVTRGRLYQWLTDAGYFAQVARASSDPGVCACGKY